MKELESEVLKIEESESELLCTDSTALFERASLSEPRKKTACRTCFVLR
jgi:hypothetical protein